MKFFHEQRLWAKLLFVVFGLSFLIPLTPAEARITFKAPEDLQAPGRRVAGGSRSPQDKKCSSGQNPLTAVVPNSNVGLTTQANPTFFFYVPQTSATLELVLRDQNKEYKQTYKSSDKGGIVSIPFNKAPLEINKVYRWSFSIVCDPQERSKDKFVEGAIKRVKTAPQLASKLATASPQQRANLYAEAGIWQDSLASLAQSLSSNPNNGELKADWQALLTSSSVGLDNLVSEPLLPDQLKPQVITTNQSN
ncbi:DUF928 domain-containing protein [Plectonema radiosum NIES-515]|uniref:DUF928 domain-containing protein n=1 Tax=Plectonema radiosum NIES-515 TaxID=2986073 RepID=A0ABT3AY84_9CYAN|nr:DUF928 domain-containing protein [Plectonema radiosum]MCV3214081.1 DUF928 domain-containing protein [Plectonema radiosum NIES-515]